MKIIKEVIRYMNDYLVLFERHVRCNEQLVKLSTERLSLDMENHRRSHKADQDYLNLEKEKAKLQAEREKLHMEVLKLQTEFYKLGIERAGR